MENTSTIVLDPEALAFNIDFLKKEFGEDVLISSVVKGNAYGHGIEDFVPLAQKCGIRHFSVFNTQEAHRVKASLSKPLPIMIMGQIAPTQMQWVIENEFSFFVYNMERLEAAIQIAQKLGQKARIHIELETGMNRTGFNQKTIIKDLIPFLLEHKKHYLLRGICTHFAGAESITNYIRIENQKKQFSKLRKLLLQVGLEPKYTHTCCSAAAIRYPKMRFNMVRIGIFQYGLWPSQEIKIEYLRRKKLTEYNLRRVLTWKTTLMALKKVNMGEYIGYGTSYQASEELSIGVVPVGYANGYSRTLSNSGRMLIRNVRTAVLGNVNMNSTTIDLNNVPDAQIGDEVVLIGTMDGMEISVASFGELSNQLNYELLTRLPIDIPRTILPAEKARDAAKERADGTALG